MPDDSPLLELTPQQVYSLQNSGEPVILIDVREPQEWQISRIEGASLIPMGSIPANVQQLERAADEAQVVIYCHHGVRSLQVVHWLRQQDIVSYSMAGGIDRWSTEIDAAVPRY